MIKLGKVCFFFDYNIEIRWTKDNMLHVWVVRKIVNNKVVATWCDITDIPTIQESIIYINKID